MTAAKIKDQHVSVKTGLSVLTVLMVRNGTALDPKLSTLAAIADALKMDIRDLFEPRSESAKAKAGRAA
jgi:transcriptional regulator with XRE-family HTH domain